MSNLEKKEAIMTLCADMFKTLQGKREKLNVNFQMLPEKSTSCQEIHIKMCMFSDSGFMQCSVSCHYAHAYDVSIKMHSQTWLCLLLLLLWKLTSGNEDAISYLHLLVSL